MNQRFKAGRWSGGDGVLGDGEWIQNHFNETLCNNSDPQVLDDTARDWFHWKILARVLSTENH